MNIAAAHSSHASEVPALNAAYKDLHNQLGGDPDLVVLGAVCGYDIAQLATHLDRLLPDAATIGTTSSNGVMTHRGFHNQPSLALWGLRDPDGAYGSALCPNDGEDRKAAARAVKEAIADAGRPGEMPSVIWIHSSPTHEEETIAGIEDVIGPHVPIVGGTSADDEFDQKWRQIAHEKCLTDGIAVAALFTSTEPLYAFHNGYEPTEHSGVITKSNGRNIWRIDDRPAAEVYNEWTDGQLIPDYEMATQKHGIVINNNVFHPLGRHIDAHSDTPAMLLSHPDHLLADGGLHLGSVIEEGDHITLMKGTRQSLVRRAGRVTSSALDIYGLDSDDIAGGLVIFCAGCLSAIKDRTDDIVDSIRTSLPHTPFLGLFTLGEQGCFIDGENRHGNLMISSLLFRRSSHPTDGDSDHGQ